MALKTLWQRLRPFVRRDLQGRLISASIAAVVIAGLAWFGISAFTHLDSADAQAARIKLGLERPTEVCSTSGATDSPRCNYDDRAQAEVDKEWHRDVRIRSAILFELDLRIDATLANLAEARDLLDRQAFDFGNGQPAGGDVRLAELLRTPDLSPIPDTVLFVNGVSIGQLSDASIHDPMRDADPEATRALLIAAIEATQTQLAAHKATVERQRARETETDDAQMVLDRNATLVDLRVHQDDYAMGLTVRDWFDASVGESLSRSAFHLANQHQNEFIQALNPSNAIWGPEPGWETPVSTKHHKSTVRYASPISDSTRYRLAGIVFLAIACVVFLIVSPIVTATATAREREAGTLPVLRMTGMSANELALAMVVGPNVFAGVLGGSLLIAGGLLLALTVPVAALLVPLALLVVLAAATHLTAIGLGDALGQRVNAMVVGALLGLGILIPGLFGAWLAVFDLSAAGLLLGPLSILTTSVAGISGIAGFDLSDDLTLVMLGFSIGAQVLLGLVCLNSWRRRVEQGWAPLFRPAEGVLLALVSVGCSALTLVDINQHHAAKDFGALNSLTFMSSAFLLPLLAWLLVVSLRRPARARAVADHVEARRAFLRFQGVLVATTGLVGGTYYMVMNKAGLATADSEIMWATLTQVLLAAETAIAVLLWGSRRRDGMLRVAFVGGFTLLLQIGAVFGTYKLEVEHVAQTNAAAMPLLISSEITGYWLVFMVLCWAAGLALIFTALMRRRDEQREAQQAAASAGEPDPDDDEFGMPGRRLIH